MIVWPLIFWRYILGFRRDFLPFCWLLTDFLEKLFLLLAFSLKTILVWRMTCYLRNFTFPFDFLRVRLPTQAYGSWHLSTSISSSLRHFIGFLLFQNCLICHLIPTSMVVSSLSTKVAGRDIFRFWVSLKISGVVSGFSCSDAFA